MKNVGENMEKTWEEGGIYANVCEYMGSQKTKSGKEDTLALLYKDAKHDVYSEVWSHLLINFIVQSQEAITVFFVVISYVLLTPISPNFTVSFQHHYLSNDRDISKKIYTSPSYTQLKENSPSSPPHPPRTVCLQITLQIPGIS